MTPLCALVKHFGRSEPISEHLEIDLCAISRSYEWLAPFVGLINGILHRPAEPLSNASARHLVKRAGSRHNQSISKGRFGPFKATRLLASVAQRSHQYIAE
jgi:hypothetical protein